MFHNALAFGGDIDRYVLLIFLRHKASSFVIAVVVVSVYVVVCGGEGGDYVYSAALTNASATSTAMAAWALAWNKKDKG